MHANFSSLSTQNCVPREASILGAPSTVEDPLWYPNSGATHHITNSPFVYLDNRPMKVLTRLKSVMEKVCVFLILVMLLFLLLVPDITKKKFSVSKFSCDNNVFFVFYPNTCYVVHQDTKHVLLQGTLKDGLYIFRNLKSCSNYSANSLSFTGDNATINLWHQRFGHCHFKSLKQILSSYNIFVKHELRFCVACVHAKCHQFPYPTTSTAYTAPLQLIYTDVWGPDLSNGAKYYVSFFMLILGSCGFMFCIPNLKFQMLSKKFKFWLKIKLVIKFVICKLITRVNFLF